MTYPLRIIFDGVVAIGPGEPKDLSSQPGPLYAVLPRANRQVNRWSRMNPVKPSYIPVHFPVVFTTLEPRQKDHNVRPPDEKYQYHMTRKPGETPPNLGYPPPVVPGSPLPPHPEPPPPFYIWYPMRERLCFQFDEETEPGLLTYDRPPGRLYPLECNPTASAPNDIYAGDVRALADMREIFPDRSRLRPEVLSLRAPVPNEVAAQVFVPRGNISSGGYGRPEGPGERVWFEPKRTGKRLEKCLVPQLIVTVEVSAVNILCYSLDSGEKLDWLGFDLNGPADIWVGNADPGDVRQVLQDLAAGTIGDGEKPLHDTDFDFDFELYYTLLEGDDDGEGLPVPKSHGRFGEPNCYVTKVGPKVGGGF